MASLTLEIYIDGEYENDFLVLCVEAETGYKILNQFKLEFPEFADNDDIKFSVSWDNSDYYEFWSEMYDMEIDLCESDLEELTFFAKALQGEDINGLVALLEDNDFNTVEELIEAFSERLVAECIEDHEEACRRVLFKEELEYLHESISDHIDFDSLFWSTSHELNDGYLFKEG